MAAAKQDVIVGTQPSQQMQCMEVWGGSQLAARSVELGGLDAWVYSKPYGQARSGGDVYYASSCATRRITRLLLADVSGHGNVVASTAADLRGLMRRFVNRLDQTEFVRLLNRQFAAMSKAGTFATAIVATFFAPSRRLIMCNAGHPRPLFYRAASREWSLLGSDDAGAVSDPETRNLPLGVIDIAEYEQFDIELEEGDCLLSYTDALTESRDAGGEMIGETGLLRTVRLLGDFEPHSLTKNLLAEIGGRHPDNLSEDDVTVLLVRANGRKARFCLRELVDAQVRFAGALLRGLKPGAERPPFPDFNLANIGGAVCPPLARRWRSNSRRSPS